MLRQAPVALRYRWIGREYDVETGFYYARARYYDPMVQRFIQEDPSGFASSSNLYAYGNGGPTGGRDLDGMRSQWADYVPDDVMNMLYRMGCWSEDCSGGGGGGGSGGGIYDEFDIAAGLFMDYSRYLKSYQAMDKGLGGMPFDALLYDQFVEVTQIIVDRLPVADVTEWKYQITKSFDQGTFALDRYQSYTTCCYVGSKPRVTWTGLRYHGEGPVYTLTIINPSVLTRGPGFIANVFDHEIVHQWAGPDECNAYKTGNRLSQYTMPLPNGCH